MIHPNMKMQGWWNRGCTGCMCTPSFLGEGTKNFSEIFLLFDLDSIVHPQFLIPCAIPEMGSYSS